VNKRERFLAACRSEPVDHPPAWIMRQAGRYLPEYRELREDHSFHEVVETPELACEVTLQPLRRFELDAAILFCDIMVIPEAMGQHYGFPEGGGIETDFAVRSREDLDKLSTDGVADHLSHVGDALELVSDKLDGQRALIGFGGAPWTLATYMVEGGSAEEKQHTKAMFYRDRELFDDLMSRITEATIRYFEMQIEAGVDALQLFDSWAGALPTRAFREASLPYIEEVIDAIDDRVPVIVFAKHMSHLAPEIAEAGADVVSVDWTVDLDRIHDGLPDDVAIQGNLDPTLLDLDPDIVERGTREMLETMEGREGYIANLGHGIHPTAKVDSVRRMIETVGQA
jgi:uroporphyrinogen decarboxylase